MEAVLFLRKLLLGVAGGLVSGAIVGLAEASFILISGHPSEYVALLYAVLLYGVIGAFAGAGIGLAFAIVHRLGWRPAASATYAMSFLAVGCSLGLVITRYVVNKVLYHETGVPIWTQIVILAIYGAIFLIGLVLGRLLLERKPFGILLGLWGTLAVYGALVLVALIFAFVLGGGSKADGTISPERAQSPELRTKPDVLLVVVDTLRADHLGAYGQHLASTPAFDAFARDAVVFEQPVAQASWTRASFASILTSLVPASHKCDVKSAMLPDEVVTIAEALRDGGVVTGGLPDNINIAASFNFQQGFDWFQYQAPAYILGATESASQLSMYNVVRKAREKVTGGAKRVQDFYQPAEVVLGAALRFISANKEKRWFLLVHLMEPHDPYFAHPYNGKAYGRAEHEHPDPALVGELRSLYKGEVEYLDGRFGEFVDQLKKDGTYDASVIIVTADHGEEFLEHDGWWHGTTLYDEQIRVPLIVKLPHQERGGTHVPWQVRSIDIAPTVALAQGVSVPESWQGRELFGGTFDADLAASFPPAQPAVPVARDMPQVAGAGEMVELPAPLAWDRSPSSRLALSEENFEGNVLSSIRDRGWKLIRANEGNPRKLSPLEVYDLVSDPGEKNNLAGKAGERQEQLDQAMRDQIASATKGAALGANTKIDAATAAKLKALGYLPE
jgi:arylsulfatase A-like enzyme